MCGIAGFVGPGDQEDLERMTSLIRHRGPDGQGNWWDKEQGIYLAHRRLAVVDIEGGVQPMWSSDGSVGVVFNGEIYNHLKLRRELEGRGHRFLTDHSDTEVLIHGYRQWGENLWNRLNGMWALALFDREKQRLLLSRDRFGKKPLFYASRPDLFAFASELTALVRHRQLQDSLSVTSLQKYFAYGYIPAPRSLYKGIYKIPAGYNLKVELRDLSVQIQRYWEFTLAPFERIPDKPEQVWGEQIRELLDRAVRRRLEADVPVGVFVSGGIDSSAVTAFASNALGRGRLKTFSIGFVEKSFDESGPARRVADMFETDHQFQKLSMMKAVSLLPGIAARLDEPVGDSSILPTYLLCRETRKNVTVALSGDGGDELFAGYDPFHALKAADLYRRWVPKPIHRGILMAMQRLPVSHRNMSLDFKIKRTLRGLGYPPELWLPVWMGPLSPDEIAQLFGEPVDIESVYSEAIECWDGCKGSSLTDRALMFFTRLYLQNDILTKTDRMSMMHSLEVRSPFLDIEVVDFVRRIPYDYKYRNGCSKYILKKALAPILPSDIRNRKKKGFGAPIGKWLKEEKLPWQEPMCFGPQNGRFFQKRYREHVRGEKDHRLFLWSHWLINACMKRTAQNGWM